MLYFLTSYLVQISQKQSSLRFATGADGDLHPRFVFEENAQNVKHREDASVQHYSGYSAESIPIKRTAGLPTRANYERDKGQYQSGPICLAGPPRQGSERLRSDWFPEAASVSECRLIIAQAARRRQ